MQRIFRRRASGSARRSRPGLLSRLPSGLFRRRSGGNRLPWGKAAAPVGTPAAGVAAPGTAPVAADGQTQVIVQELPGGAGQATSFRDRGKLRRRLRFLRRTRELAFRDIGGLIFDMRRFGRERPDLVESKIAALAAVDQELRALERVLDDRRPIHELREPGITSCARCGALHSSDSNFCPNCGLQVGGPRAMGEVGGAIAAPPQPPQPVQPPQPPQPPQPSSLFAAPAPPVAPGAVPGTAPVAPGAVDPHAADRPQPPAPAQPTEAMRPPPAHDDGS
ncbi:MAG TPA: zinc ribbon domain-containing protein [Solirubrobacteraceae bacterium]|nr:zinc ribbon domain-containing protein [Solirubrobacteraceae bacterium]